MGAACAMVASVSESPPHPENDEPPHQQPRQGWGWGHWLLVGLLLFIAVGFVIPQFGAPHNKARQLQAVNNCRQIIGGLRAYAIDHAGKYPEGETANDVFRELFKAGLFQDERAFSASASPYVGDNVLGKGPDFSETLDLWENHWAMTGGLTLKSDGNTPLIFENPVEATWPPKWSSMAVGQSKEGRIWGDWTIIVGRNDGSVSAEALNKESVPTTTLRPIKDGKNLFELAGPHEILDVAR